LFASVTWQSVVVEQVEPTVALNLARMVAPPDWTLAGQLDI
jgi:hypothetical protein